MSGKKYFVTTRNGASCPHLGTTQGIKNTFEQSLGYSSFWSTHGAVWQACHWVKLLNQLLFIWSIGCYCSDLRFALSQGYDRNKYLDDTFDVKCMDQARKVNEDECCTAIIVSAADNGEIGRKQFRWEKLWIKWVPLRSGSYFKTKILACIALCLF